MYPCAGLARPVIFRAVKTPDESITAAKFLFLGNLAAVMLCAAKFCGYWPAVLAAFRAFNFWRQIKWAAHSPSGAAFTTPQKSPLSSVSLPYFFF